MYEESIGVPLLISRPGQRRDRHVHAPVGHVDIVPTVLDELGVAAPRTCRARRSPRGWTARSAAAARVREVDGHQLPRSRRPEARPAAHYLAEVTTREAGLADLADAVRCIVTPEGEVLPEPRRPARALRPERRSWRGGEPGLPPGARRSPPGPDRPHPRLAGRHR